MTILGGVGWGSKLSFGALRRTGGVPRIWSPNDTDCAAMAVLRLASRPDEPHRALAYLCLGRLADPLEWVIQSLVQAALDPSPSVRRAAVLALGELPSAVGRSWECLLTLLGDASPLVRSASRGRQEHAGVELLVEAHAGRVATGEQRGPGRGAHGSGHVEPGEAHALAGQLVQVRGGQRRQVVALAGGAEGADVVDAEVVGDDQHDVRPRGLGAEPEAHGHRHRHRRQGSHGPAQGSGIGEARHVTQATPSTCAIVS